LLLYSSGFLAPAAEDVNTAIQNQLTG